MVGVWVLVMTVQNFAEAATTAAITAITVSTMLAENVVALPLGLPDWVVTGGMAALVGWFSAQITVRSELTELKTDLRLMRAELHRYYQPKNHQQAVEDVLDDTP